MFNRHVYTCPDIIYLRERQKKNVIVYLAMYALVFLGLNVWAKVEEKKLVEEFATAETPTD